jgi:hypothetical protein
MLRLMLFLQKSLKMQPIIAWYLVPGTSLEYQLIPHAINNGDFLNHLNQFIQAPDAHRKQVRNLAVTQEQLGESRM